MKILKFSFAFVMCLILPFMFMACGDKNGNGSGDGGSNDDGTPPTTITSSYFEIEGTVLKKVKDGVTLPSKITIPEGVTQIGNSNDNSTGNGVFKDNTQIQEVVLPKSLKTIYYNAFQNCSNLTKVTFSDVEQAKLESIFTNAFKSTKITSFTFPASCKYIGFSAFGVADGTTLTVTFKDKTNWKLYKSGNLDRSATESDFTNFQNLSSYTWQK